MRAHPNKTIWRLTKVLWVVPLTWLLVTCRNIEAPGPAESRLDSLLSVPESKLSVPIFYPIVELQQLLNEKLEDRIIDAPIAINQKGDSLFLSISKFQSATLKYDGDHSLTYQLPLLITGTVHSRLLGIDVKNKTPVQTKLLLTLQSALQLNDHWQIKTKTTIVSYIWVEEPVLRFAGIKIKLRSPIEKMLDKNQEKIIQKLDQAIGTTLKAEETVKRLWLNLQKPILINKKIKPVWIKAEPISMSEEILKRSRDTLAVGLNLKVKLQTLLDTAHTSDSKKTLDKQDLKLKSDNALNAYLLVTIPFQDINQIVEQITDTMRFEFEGHHVRIRDSQVYGTEDGLAVRLDFVGDVKARLYLTGEIGYDTATRNLVLNNFGFDVNSEESLINAADWFSHDEIINRVQPHLAVSVGQSIEALPSLIFQGVEKGKLGEKIEIYFSHFDASLDQHLITKDNIQVIIRATGRADIQLQKGLFARKKKKL